MRILVVCGAGRLYGKEMLTLSLMEGLKNRGHEVACVTSTWNDGEFIKGLEELSISYSPIPLGFISKTFTWSALHMTLVQAIRLPELWWGYGKVIGAFKPDVVIHSNVHHVTLLWSVMGGNENIFHVHDAFSPTAFHRRLFTVFSRKISKFVGVSSFVAQSLLTLGLPESKVSYVLNGITFDESYWPQIVNDSDSRNDANLKNGPVRIGIVGQVEEWKGHEDLVDALHMLQKKGQSFVCKIFGAGSREFVARLKDKIEDYGLGERVEWMGFVNGRKSIYEQIDICVVPSRIPEAFGMVAAEASMYGIPVVASRIGALPEVVLNNHTGFLVDVGSADQIAEKICVLSSSQASRIEMGRSAREYVKTSLGSERMISQLEAVLGRYRN